MENIWADPVWKAAIQAGLGILFGIPLTIVIAEFVLRKLDKKKEVTRIPKPTHEDLVRKKWESML